MINNGYPIFERAHIIEALNEMGQTKFILFIFLTNIGNVLLNDTNNTLT